MGLRGRSAGCAIFNRLSRFAVALLFYPVSFPSTAAPKRRDRRAVDWPSGHPTNPASTRTIYLG